MNLSRIITRAGRCFGDKPALIFGDRTYTYAQLEASIDAWAGRLRRRGLAPGDRAAIFLPNRPEWIMAYYAAIRLGGEIVGISPLYRKAEVRWLLQDSGAKVVISSEALKDQLPDASDGLAEVVLVEEEGPLAADINGQRPIIEESQGSAEDTAVVLYTGGTTGRPKGALLSHQNILYTAQNVCYHERVRPEDVSLCFMPLGHVFGGNHIMNSLFYGCGTMVLHPGFDQDRIVADIERHRITRFYSIPTGFIRLLRDPGARQRLGSLTYCFSAAASLPVEIVRQWREAFGLGIHEAYGLTETSSLVTFNHLYRHKIGSVGTPAGLVEVRIADDQDRTLPPGQEGEILIRGPNVMKGYLNQPDESAKVLRGGWLHSGDVGRLDEDGYLYIVDRIKDLIISGGLNVYPREVEEVLFGHEAVEECAVIGRPDPEWGESVQAVIRLKQGRQASPEEIIAFCKARLASFKAPKSVVFVTEFPKSGTGKILKRELRKRLA